MCCVTMRVCGCCKKRIRNVSIFRDCTCNYWIIYLNIRKCVSCTLGLCYEGIDDVRNNDDFDLSCVEGILPEKILFYLETKKVVMFFKDDDEIENANFEFYNEFCSDTESLYVVSSDGESD